MSHQHEHTTAGRPLAIALTLILGLMVAEVAAAFVAGSLALFADAGHMLTDAAALLARPSRESLNVRGAFLHVATDLAAFAGTAIAGGIILATGWNRADPVASLVVAGLIFWSSWNLLRESTRILLDVAPSEPREVAEAMLDVPEVVEVHDLHVWTVGSGFPSVSAHVLVEPGSDCHAIRLQLATVLRERFELGHSTLQVEHAPAKVPQGNLPLASR